MVTLRRAQILNMVEHSFFSNIDHRKPGTVLDCMASDAVWTVFPPATPHNGRDSGIKRLIGGLLARYETIRHSDLAHVIDAESQRIATHYDLELRDGADVQVNTRGCTLIFFENGKFKTLATYLSAPVPLS